MCSFKTEAGGGGGGEVIYSNKTMFNNVLVKWFKKNKSTYVIYKTFN